MTKTRPLKNPQDEPGIPAVYKDDERDLHLWPISGFSPKPHPALYCDDKKGPWALHLGPGGEGLKEDDWLRCAPTFPACGWPNGM